MNSKMKIVVVDDSQEVRMRLSEYFSAQEDFVYAGDAADGMSGLKLIETAKPDLVVLDLVMPHMDGFGVLREMSDWTERPGVLVLSALAQDRFIEHAMTLGADYYMLKPYDLQTMRKVLLDIMLGKSFTLQQLENTVEAKPVRGGKSIDEKISNIFITVGIPAHIKGYQFLREAIKLTIERPEIINSITKELYPTVAQKFQTSPSKVERAIRHAIEVAWNRGKIENINGLFGIRVYTSHEKPTNGEFIALVADKMLIEGA